MKKHLEATVTGNELISGNWYAMRLECPEIAEQAAPGQFVQLRAWEGASPLLARPVGVAGVPEPGVLLFWIDRVGEGTRLITSIGAGGRLRITGPLGRGFTMPAPGETVYYASGHVGAAPLRFVVERQQGAKRQVFFHGAGTACGTEAALADPVISKTELIITTDDGSAGECGLVTEPLKRALESEKPDRILACGPKAMLKAVAQLAAEVGARCEVSLESHFGCGLGACMGCAVPVLDSAGKKYAHVCADGPVFDAAYIDWEAI
jgi:dihydroorotate dehydrogenase electron transfer subunit